MNQTNVTMPYRLFISPVRLLAAFFVLPLVTFGQEKKSSPSSSQTMGKSILTTPQAPQPIGPYSQGVIAGNLIFISGQVGKHPGTGELITGDIQSETRQVMENIQAILTAAGTDFSSVVKTTVFLTDMKNFPAMNEVYGSFFSGDFPARETVAVAGLPLGVNVEISMIAVK
jgi:2-iminobutanoate/2-iminopropanoate deaminase